MRKHTKSHENNIYHTLTSDKAKAGMEGDTKEGFKIEYESGINSYQLINWQM